MQAKKFARYLKLKEKSPLHPISAGKIIDEWVESFLTDKPNKQQFVRIFENSHISANATHSLWKTRP